MILGNCPQLYFPHWQTGADHSTGWTKQHCQYSALFDLQECQFHMVQLNAFIMRLLENEMRLAWCLAYRNAPWTVAIVHLIPPSAQSYFLSLQKVTLAILCIQAARYPWAFGPEALRHLGWGRGWSRYLPSPHVTAHQWSDHYFWSVLQSWCLPSTEENCFCHILQ